MGNSQKPLLQLFPFHLCAGPPGAAVGVYLFICENGLIDRVPVDFSFGAVSKISLEELQEDILGVLVVGWVGGSEFLQKACFSSRAG